jgi:hypothetical protein
MVGDRLLKSQPVAAMCLSEKRIPCRSARCAASAPGMC